MFLRSTALALIRAFSLGLAGACIALSPAVHAAGPNPNLIYYGYDWLDGGFEANATQTPVATAYSDLSATGPNKTNLNVVHTINNLTSACANGKCALGIQAGTGGSTWLDICPGATSNSACTGQDPWSKIWTIVGQIKTVTNKPTAIYFIDEPSLQAALRQNGSYVTWQYAGYVCTLRQALASNGLGTIKVFTVLGMGEVSTGVINEMKNQMPTSGCPATVRSFPDWIGFDNYEWKKTASVDNAPTIHNLYTTHFPPGGSMPKWILVPPADRCLASTQSNILACNQHLQSPIWVDQDLRDRLQVYWDYLYNYPSDPVVFMMNHKTDPRLMNPSRFGDAAVTWQQSRDMLRFMGNSLTP